MLTLFVCFCGKVRGKCIFRKGLPQKQLEYGVVSLQETEAQLVTLGCSVTGPLPPASYGTLCSISIRPNPTLFLSMPSHEGARCTPLHMCALEPKSPGHLPRQKPSSKNTQAPFGEEQESAVCVAAFLSRAPRRGSLLPVRSQAGCHGPEQAQPYRTGKAKGHALP